MSSITFALNPRLDPVALADKFDGAGRVRVKDFLAPGLAEQLHQHLRGRTDWRQMINNGAKVLELDRSTRAAFSPEQRAMLDDGVYGSARSGFQFRYEALRVPDDDGERRRSTDLLATFARWLSGGAPRDLMRTITGAKVVAFADAQATAFAPGDFLTGHDDVIEGRHRHAAYVFGLNPVWRTEWGGLLLFHDGQAVSGVVPALNTIDIFRVGQMHSVSEVTRSAAYRRYSITGWLRSR